MKKLIDRLNEEQFAPMTKDRDDELSNLFVEAEKANDTELIKKIREEYVNRHLRLILYIGKGYKRALDNDDIFSVGLVALTHAFDNWIPFKGSTYSWAERWIQTGLTRALDHDRLIRIPQKLAYQSALLEIDIANLKAKLHRDPTNEEIQAIKNNRTSFREYNHVSDSIDREVNAGGVYNGVITVGELIVDNDSDPYLVVEHNDMVKSIGNALGELTEIEQYTITSRFGLGDADRLTLAELGIKFGVTGEAMRRVEASALAKLKHPAIKTDLLGI